MSEPDAGKGRVLVVGSINVDLVIRAARLPRPGETVTGGSFSRHHGGKGANQAVAAARLGAAVTLVGAVGDDDLGAGSIAGLESEHIDISRVARLADVATGVALIVVDDEGENQIAVASGANARVDGAMVESALADHAFEGGGVLLANFEVPDDALMSGARLAARNGMRVLINPSPARPLPSEIIALRPILVPNEIEAQALTGEPDPEEAARALYARTGAPVMVTLGADGALVLTDDTIEHLPAPRVGVVDTTGAGDTFAGALAAELAAGRSLIEAARVAVRAASLSVTAAGARAAMPTRAQLAGPG